jgi:hypothetical protein
MFSLHERTQRKVCRTAFVLVCAVPTFMTLCWVLYFHRSWHEQDWQHSLENELHVRVEIEQVSAPRPQERRIREVQLADLQSKKPLIKINELSIVGTGSFTAQQIAVHCSQIEQLAQAAQVWLAGESFQHSSWQVDHLNLMSTGGPPWELENLRCETNVLSNGSRQFSLQANLGDDVVRFLLERNREGRVRATLDTGQASLPAWLLADVIPGASRWRQATFTGVLELVRQNSSVAGEFRGQVLSIDTQAWIGNDQLQTIADLQFDKLHWRDGRVEVIQGTLAAEKGQISNALLLTLKNKLRCPQPIEPPADADAQFQDFDQFGCRFHINTEGFTVSGSFPHETQWAMMLRDGRPLVMQPAYSRLPLAFLIESVCTPSGFSVPATREATSLAEKLPLPEAESKKK